MNAESLLERMAEKYASCRTYADSGVAQFNSPVGEKERLEFRTLFIRPGYLSFEWQDYGPRRGKSTDFSVLWSEDGIHRVKYIWGVEEIDSLSLAIAGATGCSSAAASVVTSLLLVELQESSKHLLTLSDLEIKGEDVLDGICCFVLNGSLLKRSDTTLLIAKDDFSIRRCVEDRSLTADESKLQHDALLADGENMARLREAGIELPVEMKHSDTRLLLEYDFKTVSFDEPVRKLIKPE